MKLNLQLFASGTIDGGKYNDYYSYYITWSSVPNTPGNYSDVTANWVMKKTARDPYGAYNTSGSSKATIYIATVGSGETTANFDMRNSAIGATITLKSWTKRIYHGDDGRATVKIGGLHKTGLNWGNKEIYDHIVTLDTIPRYGTSNQSLNSVDETNIRMNWSSNNIVDYLWYSIDNGASWIDVGWVNTNSGAYTISGLSPNRTYNIKTRIRRKDSQLITDSSNLPVATYQYPYISGVGNQSLIIGENQTLYLYNPLGRYVTVYMKKDSTSGTQLYSGVTTGTSITFNPDNNTLYNTIPNNTEGNAVYYCDYSSQVINVLSGKYIIDVNTSKPTFNNFEYETNLEELTGNKDTIIDGISNVLIKISSSNKAIGNNGATIKRYHLECGSQNDDISYSNTLVSKTLLNCSSNIIRVTAVDSRGLERTVTKTVTNYKNYTRPLITSTNIQRKNGVEEETHLNLEITFWNNNFGIKDNKIVALKYRTKKASDSNWQEWNNINVGLLEIRENKANLSDYLIHYDGISSGFEVGVAYNIQFQVSDGNGEILLSTSEGDILSITDGKVAFSILKDRDGNYHIGINGMPDLNHALKVYGTISNS